jgi:outer membrane protein W
VAKARVSDKKDTYDKFLTLKNHPRKIPVYRYFPGIGSKSDSKILRNLPESFSLQRFLVYKTNNCIMKKVLLSAAVLFAALSGNAQAFTKGSSTVNLGYGFLNVNRTTFKLFTFGDPTAKTSSMGPVVVGYEYGVTDRISVGAQVGYGQVKTTWTDDNDKTTLQLNQLTAIIRGAYHFGNGENFDPYVALGVGYNNFKFTAKENDKTIEGFAYAVPTAIGYTAALGGNYYFSKNIGAYAEVGYTAGSLIQIGVKAKF